MSDVLETLGAHHRRSQAQPAAGVIHGQLFEAGMPRIAQKVGEEGVETVVAALSQGDERVVAEMADLVYHCLVLLSGRVGCAGGGCREPELGKSSVSASRSPLKAAAERHEARRQIEGVVLQPLASAPSTRPRPSQPAPSAGHRPRNRSAASDSCRRQCARRRSALRPSSCAFGRNSSRTKRRYALSRPALISKESSSLTCSIIAVGCPH